MASSLASQRLLARTVVANQPEADTSKMSTKLERFTYRIR
jgi:hypothetical protein